MSTHADHLNNMAESEKTKIPREQILNIYKNS